MDAVLFDLDDTLLNYSEGADAVYARSLAEVANPLGLDVPALVAELDAVRQWFWGDPIRHRRERTDMPGAWRKIYVEALCRQRVPAARAEALGAEMARRFTDARWEVVRPLPGAFDLLEALAARGVPLGMITNGDAAQQREKLRRFDLERHFRVIVIEGEFGRGKPDREVFAHALEVLGVEARQTWMVGDNLEFDIGGAQALGARGVWIDRHGKGPPAGAAVRPDRVVSSVAELDDWR